MTHERVSLDNPAHFECGNRTKRPEDYGSVFMTRTASGGFGFWFDRAEQKFACLFYKGHGPQTVGEDLLLHNRIFRVKDWTDAAKREIAIRPRETA